MTRAGVRRLGRASLAILVAAIVGAMAPMVPLARPPIALAAQPSASWSPAPVATPGVDADWWVDAAGSDDASGRVDAPFATLARALRDAQPGDTIVLGPGRHAGADVRVRGTARRPITIRGSGVDVTIIDGTIGGRRDTLVFRGRSGHLVVQDLTVTGSSGDRSAGILVDGPLSGPLLLERLRLTANDGYGALLQAARDVRITASELDRNRTGVEVNRDGANVVIEDSAIHDNDRLIRSTPREVAADDDYGATGVSLVRTTGPVVVRRNRVWGNRAPSPDYGWDGSAFEIFGASGVSITDNVAWDNEELLETGTLDREPCADNVFARNVAWGAASAGRARGIILRCGRDMLLAHLTLADLDDHALLIGDERSRFAGSIRGSRLTDSVLVQANAGAPLVIQRGPRAGFSVDHTLLWNDAGPIALVDGRGRTDDLVQLARWLRAPGDLGGSIIAPPRFVDRVARDLRLAPGSPAIDAGVVIDGVTGAWSGDAPDLGAIEAAAPSAGPLATPLHDPYDGPHAHVLTSGDVSATLVLPLDPGTEVPIDGVYQLRYIDGLRNALVVTLETSDGALTGAFVAVGVPGTSIMDADYYADFLRDRCTVEPIPVPAPDVQGNIDCRGLQNADGTRTIDVSASYDTRQLGVSGSAAPSAPAPSSGSPASVPSSASPSSSIAP